MSKRAWQVGAIALSAVGITALTAAPRAARACGGLFCDRPPPNPFDPLPVAQSGENIVFAVDTDPVTGTGTVEAHIQIFYKGPADQFSWVVPVDSQPTVSVGSDQIFTAAAAATLPSYQLSWATEGTCKMPAQVAHDPTGGFPTSTGAGGSTGGAGPVNGGVNVAFMGAVGPYLTSVIQSGSSAALLKWLSDNGYFVGDDAAQIIAQYVSEQKFFVAIKLLGGKDVGAIQPIVLKFAGVEPCVPLRLTAIAALSDLQVNLWVLGDSRAVPKNYFEIKLNDAKLDWLGGAGNYAELVKSAADEAGGNAFIAEYAGTARVLDGRLWPNPRINVAALLAATTPPAYLQQVAAQGLTQYGPMLDLLRTYIPEPKTLKDMGISEAQFYNQNALYWAQYQAQFIPFDPAAITNDVAKVIIEPLKAGQALFDGHTYLTRLATYISPEEMTRDPLFIFNPDLPVLSNVHRATAHVMCGDQLYYYCEAPVRLDLPDSKQLWFQRTGDSAKSCGRFERGDLDQMPALDVAYQRSEAGEGNHVADNGTLITRAISMHNAPLAVAIARVSGSSGPTPLLGGGTGMGGCGCNQVAGRASLGAAVLLLVALALARRSRDR